MGIIYKRLCELPPRRGDGMGFGSQLLLYLYIKLIIAYIQLLVAMLPRTHEQPPIHNILPLFNTDKFPVQFFCS